MSEEILKALMQLFAIILKQDDAVNDDERAFVERFLKQQLNPEMVAEYYALFEGFLTEGTQDTGEEKKKKLTSVKDSVKTLSICKKINKTLTQKQKIIVLIRLFELIGQKGGSEGGTQRKEIVHTVSDVFNISQAEFSDIENFCQIDDFQKFLPYPNFLLVGENLPKIADGAKVIENDIDQPIALLRVSSEDMYFLRYSGSNTLSLNGLPVNRTQISLFAYGSTLKLPHGEPIYYSDIHAQFLSAQDIPKLSFEANALGFKFPNGAVGLKDINLNEGGGKLIAIMGGSGAGKTTLLNVLAGLEKPSEGAITVNGIDINKEKEKIEGVIGYVAQDDILFEELTVFQNLYYNAKLCFKDYSEEQLLKAVSKTLKSLGLYEIKDIKVGNVLNKKISGGQRKRLNIALELIREPVILFLDEPTSGLSSRDSENVIDLLKELTLKGKLIFVVIHQPSSDIYKMFDKVVILDVGGFQIYYGNPVNAVTYFKKLSNQINAEEGQCAHCGNVNPEQVFNTIDAKVVDEYGNLTETRKVSSKLWNQYFKVNLKSEKNEKITEAPPKTLKRPSKLAQFWVFVKRDILSKVSNTQYLLINLLEAPLLGFLLSFIIRYVEDPKGTYHYEQNENIPAFIFMATIVALFMGLTVSAEEIIRDAKILKRESFLNLSRFSYLASKVVILFLLSAIQTISFVVIGNLILEIKDMNIAYWLILFSLSCSANMLGLIISSTFNSAVTIYILIPILLIPQMVLSGAIFSFDKLNKTLSSKDKVPMIADLMVSRWAFEGLAVKQFKDNKFEKVFYELEKAESEADYIDSYWAPKMYAKLDACATILSKGGDGKQLAYDFDFVRREILLINSEIPDLKLDLTLLKAKAAHVDQTLLTSYREKVKSIEKYNVNKYLQANLQKDEILNKFHGDPKSQKLYEKTKMECYNESLAELVKKESAKNKILEYEGGFLQVKDPVYKDPDKPSNPFNFRTHLYAPHKYFLNKKIDTFWFNVGMIWFMSFIMFIILYFNILKKLLVFNK